MGVRKKALIIGLLGLFLFPSMVSAQWVFLGRKALGLVSRIADQVHGHESASVLLEADADKVFGAAERIVRERPQNQILSADQAERTLSFKHGGRAITLKVERLQDDLAQILVVSSGGDTPQDADYVVNGILRICKEVGAHCWTSDE